MAIDDIEKEILETSEEVDKLVNAWMLDSGASRHMTYQRNISTEIISYCV